MNLERPQMKVEQILHKKSLLIIKIQRRIQYKAYQFQENGVYFEEK